MTEAALSATMAPARAEARTVTGAAPGGPVLPHERIELLDVLRGFALFGILQVNFNDWDGWLGDLLTFTNDGSYYTTYSFLFGLGFAVQLIRAGEKKRPFAARYLWRSLLLYGIGAAHFAFLWNGDIVRIYGVLAILLLLFYRGRNGFLIALAAVSLLFSLSPRNIGTRGTALSRPSPEMSAPTRAEAIRVSANLGAASQMIAQGGGDGEYGNIVRGRAVQLSFELRSLDLSWFKAQSDIFALFLLGIVFGRMGVFREPERHHGLLVRMLVYGFILGVVGNTFDVFNTEQLRGLHLPGWLGEWRDSIAYSIGNIALAAFYVSAVTLLFTYRAWWRRVLAPLANVGRMGLTNYLAQSLALSILLYRPGFDLDWPLVGWNQQLLLIAFFVVQMWYSAWWFRRFQFGPVEWMWRSLTWFRMPAMRRKPVEA